MQYNKQQILKIVNTQLLFWIKKDETVKEAVFELVETKHPTRKESDDKFDRMLKELANDREEQKKKWADDKVENNIKWEAQEKKWAENQINIEKILDRIDKYDSILNSMLGNITDLNKKYTVNLGSIGTRWGIATESSFRLGLKSILETDFPVKVINYNKMDNEHLVYNRPAPVEIDVIIHNGKIILCEISASFSPDDVDAFAKKIHFYEMKEKVKVSRSIIISPMMTPQALEAAQYYGIETFSYPERLMF